MRRALTLRLFGRRRPDGPWGPAHRRRLRKGGARAIDSLGREARPSFRAACGCQRTFGADDFGDGVPVQDAVRLRVRRALMAID